MAAAEMLVASRQHIPNMRNGSAWEIESEQNEMAA